MVLAETGQAKCHGKNGRGEPVHANQEVSEADISNGTTMRTLDHYTILIYDTGGKCLDEQNRED